MQSNCNNWGMLLNNWGIVLHPPTPCQCLMHLLHHRLSLLLANTSNKRELLNTPAVRSMVCAMHMHHRYYG